MLGKQQIIKKTKPAAKTLTKRLKVARPAKDKQTGWDCTVLARVFCFGRNNAMTSGQKSAECNKLLEIPWKYKHKLKPLQLESARMCFLWLWQSFGFCIDFVIALYTLEEGSLSYKIKNPFCVLLFINIS